MRETDISKIRERELDGGSQGEKEEVRKREWMPIREKG